MAVCTRANTCSCAERSSAASQSMDEMDFERGLWAAARDGNIERLRMLLDKGRDPNQPDAYGYTALHYASRQGHLEIVKELLNRGACRWKKTNGGALPVHRAAYAGHLEILYELLANQMEMVTDSDGDTIIHKAAKGGSAEVVRNILVLYPHLNESENAKGEKWNDLMKNENDAFMITAAMVTR